MAGASLYRMVAQGQQDGEGAALPRRAFDLYLPMMLAYKRGDDGEAQPGSSAVARARGIDAVEAFKNVGQVFRRDADACVRDFDYGPLLSACDSDGYAAACRGIVDAVLDQVVKNAGEQPFIARHYEIGLIEQVERDPSCGGDGLKLTDGLFQQRAWRDFAGVERLLSGCEDEQVGDQAFQACQGAFLRGGHGFVIIERGVFVGDHYLKVGAQRGERGAQFVSYITHKAALQFKILLQAFEHGVEGIG